MLSTDNAQSPPVGQVDQQQLLMNLGKACKGSEYPFPVKLHFMLNDAEKKGLDSIVSWLPNGKGFIIHNAKEAAKHILPHWFRQKCYGSFQRQLNLYSFKRIKCGSMKGGYHHELFEKGKPLLSYGIRRVPIKNVQQRNHHLSYEAVTSSWTTGSSTSCAFVPSSMMALSSNTESLDHPSGGSGVTSGLGDWESESTSCSSPLHSVMKRTLSRTALLSGSKFPSLTSLLSPKDMISKNKPSNPYASGQTSTLLLQQLIGRTSSHNKNGSRDDNLGSLQSSWAQYLAASNENGAKVAGMTSPSVGSLNEVFQKPSGTLSMTELLLDPDLSRAARKNDHGDSANRRMEEQQQSLGLLMENFEPHAIQAEIIRTFLSC